MDEITHLQDQSKQLKEQRQTLSKQLKVASRKRQRLVKKLKNTTTEDLALMIAARQREDQMRQAMYLTGGAQKTVGEPAAPSGL